MRLVGVILLCTSLTFAGQKHVTVSGAGAHTGMDVSNAWSPTEANASVEATDTLNYHAGTYSVIIQPGVGGTWLHPVVVRPYGTDVVTVSMTSTTAIIEHDWIWVQNMILTLQSYHAADVIDVQNCDYSGFIGCTITGGTSSNNADYANWPAYKLSNVRYSRILGNLFDRQDTLITTDDLRGDGIDLYGDNSNYNVIEGNTVRRVSHYGIAVPYGGYSSGGRYNMVRNNTTYLNHVGWGPTDYSGHNWYEGNTSYLVGTPLTYRGGDAIEASGDTCVFRYNKTWDDAVNGSTSLKTEANSAFLTQESGGCYFENCRVYHNTFLGHNNLAMNRDVVWSQNYTAGRVFGRNVWVNNIFAYPNDPWGPHYSTCFLMQWATGTFPDTLRGNALFRGTEYHEPGDSVFCVNDVKMRLATAKSTYPNNVEASNINASPNFLDSLSEGHARNLTLAPSSPLINTGVSLTVVTSIVSNSTLVPVGDASYFYWAHGGNVFERGDSIIIDGTVKGLVDSSYGNTLVLHSPVTVSSGASVNVLATWSQLQGYINRLQGAPDIGACEYGSTIYNPSLPDTTTQVSPTNGSTPTQPITFRWTHVSGATKYYLCIGSPTWDTLYVNDSTIVDTFKTVNSLPVGVSCRWNMAVGNAVGWNYTAWAHEWSFTVGEAATRVFPGVRGSLWQESEDSMTLIGSFTVHENLLTLCDASGELASVWQYIGKKKCGK